MKLQGIESVRVRSQVEGSIVRESVAISGGGKRLQVEGSYLERRGATSGGRGGRSRLGGVRFRWRVEIPG